MSNRKNKVFDVKFLVKTFGVNKKDHRIAVNAGQTLNHGLLAIRHSIAGQGLAKAVCKATTEELIASTVNWTSHQVRFILKTTYSRKPYDFS